MCVCVPSFSVMTAALHRPVLSYTVISDDGKDIKVTIKWATSDSTKRDMEYVLLMRNSTMWNVSETYLDLTLRHGIRYVFTVMSHRCEGNIMSKPSQPLHIFYPGIAVFTCTHDS